MRTSRPRRIGRLFAALVTSVSVATPVVLTLSTAQSSAATFNPAASLDQCQNGQVSPITLKPCVNGTIGANSYSDWVNGDVQGNKAHWREGDFIPYRANLSGLPGGGTSITISGTYDTVKGSTHAIDYLGSFAVGSPEPRQHRRPASSRFRRVTPPTAAARRVARSRRSPRVSSSSSTRRRRTAPRPSPT